MTNIEETLIALDCEVQINTILLDALIVQSPNPQGLLRTLQAEIDQMSVVQTGGASLEHVVELRARAEQRVNLLKKLIASSAGG